MNNVKIQAGTNAHNGIDVGVTSSSQTIAKPHVSGSAVEPKVVNNGNVFGTGNWFTFYCGKCGSQLPSKVEKCVGGNPFDKGCGTAIKWS